MTDLDAPRSPGELYLARGAEVEPYRPVMTGDVFRDVAIPGVENGPSLAMVVAHPCSMRDGAHVRSHVQMAAIRAGPPIPLSGWNGHFGAMPVPDLLSEGDLTLRAVFELAGRVETAMLPHDRRIACLSTPGILLLLQRLTFSLTRLALETDVLLQSIDYVLEEAELLEDWMRSRMTSDVGEDLVAAIRAHELAFDEVMSQETDGSNLRASLRDPKLRATVRRTVHAALAQGQVG